MMYEYLGQKRAYSVLSFERRRIKLTQDEDDEFSDWLSMKIKGGNL